MDKRERLDDYLERNELESVWFARPNAFAWLTGGNSVVDRETPTGVAVAGYDGDDVRIVTTNNEANRIEDEELPDLDTDAVSVEQFGWQTDSLAKAVAARVGKDERAAADIDVPGLERVDPTPLRQPLTEQDQERYRRLGRETAAAVESVCRELRTGDSEHEVASALRVALSARNIEAPVILVGGSERAQRYRHYTPTDAELGDYALVSVTTERAGLHASCTRTVAFDAPEWLTERHEAAARVETTALAATRKAASTGGTAGDVFTAIQDAYDEVGYPDEWMEHHQGGAAGFSGREWIATPGHEASVVEPMAYAWNPTIEGAKSEDTVLLADGEFEVLTATDNWPTTTVEAVASAGDAALGNGTGDEYSLELELELERPAVLELD
ncbi:peptidase M24 family protein [Natrialba magadii ATCC 43099]|uniref:Peptidase M24 n=1 Tax=Natrialba magadii (strain ATCC 43099 / DSM 3394 / CCM 3739 / CIP 104546 / IAM 13178 / JCM 8861 / NBRC 102185 / NCIMB 2190 / MS3) TaxID=547559 RepID=D3SZ88_NATMM|nr:M24 family metallopeptidase [Natrialba magadii]ADD04222.1 peptidase M24 family protein [Natrialba magadii ATCC 43099]ELY26626.1 peptidase M24 [Natrialba magadii ATCC 43099]